ncbi:MAG: LysE family translocator [Bacteroidota bacterium]|nr:LysE family translocator [Bacteroidota bacterium]
MISVFLEGVALGLLLAFSFGPAFFAVIQTGIDRGFRAGLLFSLGILISDISFIAIAYVGAESFLSGSDSNLYIGLVGGAILIVFGGVTFMKKPEILRRRSPRYKTPKAPTPLSLLTQGFFLNLLNPFIFLFWIAAMGIVSTHSHSNDLLSFVLVFFSGTIFTVFSGDLLKCYIGYKIKNFLRPRYIFWINRLTGVLLMIFGVVLLVRVISNFPIM